MPVTTLCNYFVLESLEEENNGGVVQKLQFWVA